jgi:hypothetical protein
MRLTPAQIDEMRQQFQKQAWTDDEKAQADALCDAAERYQWAAKNWHRAIDLICSLPFTSGMHELARKVDVAIDAAMGEKGNG